jgi:ketosteroid isomerase-like protein
MSELDDFLSEILDRQIRAEKALHNGDATLRMEMWSHRDPVTLFGAAVPINSGWDEVSRTFGWLASGFSDNTAYEFELVAAGVSGDLAYTVAFEHTSVSINGVPAKPYTLRVTHIYRREDGEWKIVHRHGDYPPIDQGFPAQVSTK